MSTANAMSVLWDGHAADSLARRCGVPLVELMAETDSSQNVAHALAEKGAPAGTTIVADAQTAGRANAHERGTRDTRGL